MITNVNAFDLKFYGVMSIRIIQILGFGLKHLNNRLRRYYLSHF